MFENSCSFVNHADFLCHHLLDFFAERDLVYKTIGFNENLYNLWHSAT